MEEGYSYFQSANIYVEIFREVMPFIFAIILFYFYSQKKINIIETLLYALATEAYTAIVIGPTINATFFLSYIFLFQQLHKLVTGRLYIKKQYLTLLVLPALSGFAVFLIISFYR